MDDDYGFIILLILARCRCSQWVTRWVSIPRHCANPHILTFNPFTRARFRKYR